MPYTSLFCAVNGLDLNVSDFAEDSDDVEAFGRGGGLDFEGVSYGERRKWQFTTPPYTAEDSDSLKGWLKGRGHQWTFEYVDAATTRFTFYSQEGGLGLSFASGATYSSTSKFGLWALQVHAGGSAVSTTATFGAERGCSMSVWRRVPSDGDTYELCSITWDGATLRYYAGASGTGVTTAFAWTTGTGVTYGYFPLVLEGQNNAGSNVTVIFDGLWLVPYTLSTSMLSARAQRTEVEGSFPYVKLAGMALRDNREVEVKGFVTGREPRQLVIDGQFRPNREEISGTFVER